MNGVTEVNLYWPSSYFIAQVFSFEIVRILLSLKLDVGRPAAGKDIRHPAAVRSCQCCEAGANIIPAAVGGVGEVGDLQLIIDLTQ